MSEAENRYSQLGNFQDSETAEYQVVSGLAVAGLIVGLVSCISLLSPMLLFVPLLGIVLGVLARRQIARNESMLTGRKMALAGLVLSVLWCTTATSHMVVYRWWIRNEARQFAETWFEFLRQDQPHVAHQLTQVPRLRAPLDEKLWQFYEKASESVVDLDGFVKEREIGTLLALGDKALVRYYDTQEQWGNFVYLVYAVTYEEDGKTRTFFVGLQLERSFLEHTRTAHWHVSDVEGGIRPAALGEEQR